MRRTLSNFNYKTLTHLFCFFFVWRNFRDLGMIKLPQVVLLAKRIQYLLHFSVLYVVQKSFLGLRYFVNRIQKTYHKVCFKSANPRYWCSNQDPNAENGAKNTAGIIKMHPVFLPSKIGDSPKPTKTSFELNY